MKCRDAHRAPNAIRSVHFQHGLRVVVMEWTEDLGHVSDEFYIPQGGGVGVSLSLAHFRYWLVLGLKWAVNAGTWLNKKNTGCRFLGINTRVRRNNAAGLKCISQSAVTVCFFLLICRNKSWSINKVFYVGQTHQQNSVPLCVKIILLQI